MKKQKTQIAFLAFVGMYFIINVLFRMQPKTQILNLKNNKKMKTKNVKYPFKEGDDYWTIENNEVVWSCWDYVSEELFSLDKKYYSTEKEAENELI